MKILFLLLIIFLPFVYGQNIFLERNSGIKYFEYPWSDELYIVVSGKILLKPNVKEVYIDLLFENNIIWEKQLSVSKKNAKENFIYLNEIHGPIFEGKEFFPGIYQLKISDGEQFLLSEALFLNANLSKRMHIDLYGKYKKIIESFSSVCRRIDIKVNEHVDFFLKEKITKKERVDLQNEKSDINACLSFLKLQDRQFACLPCKMHHSLLIKICGELMTILNKIDNPTNRMNSFDMIKNLIDEGCKIESKFFCEDNKEFILLLTTSFCSFN